MKKEEGAVSAIIPYSVRAYVDEVRSRYEKTTFPEWAVSEDLVHVRSGDLVIACAAYDAHPTMQDFTNTDWIAYMHRETPRLLNMVESLSSVYGIIGNEHLSALRKVTEEKYGVLFSDEFLTDMLVLAYLALRKE